MTSSRTTNSSLKEIPDTDFWAECRREAIRLNIPAWMIAEQSFVHDPVDDRAASH